MCTFICTIQYEQQVYAYAQQVYTYTQQVYTYAQQVYTYEQHAYAHVIMHNKHNYGFYAHS